MVAPFGCAAGPSGLRYVRRHRVGIRRTDPGDRTPVTENTTQGTAESELERAHEADGPLLVNGVDFEVSLPCTVAALLARLEMGGKRVAVSINRCVVPRSRHPEALVHAGDRVEILEAVGGG